MAVAVATSDRLKKAREGNNALPWTPGGIRYTVQKKKSRFSTYHILLEELRSWENKFENKICGKMPMNTLFWGLCSFQ